MLLLCCWLYMAVGVSVMVYGVGVDWESGGGEDGGGGKVGFSGVLVFVVDRVDVVLCMAGCCLVDVRRRWL